MATIRATIKEVSNDWTVPENGEFRFEVDPDERVSLRVLSGRAELFGTELVAGPNARDYEFCGAKGAIFSYTGAHLRVKGRCVVEYVSTETPMAVYLNTHVALETRRKEAAQKGEDGPRVLVLGSGRNALTRILVNYAVRAGKKPLLVDIDSNNGTLMFPTVLSAQHIDKVFDPEDGTIPDSGPCCYFYGRNSPKDNPKLYMKLASHLARAANGKLAELAIQEPQLRAGAFIIAAADSEDMLRDIQGFFHIDVIMVVGNERLHSGLVKQFQDCPQVTILKLPKSGGIVPRDSVFRRHLMQKQLRNYFYGPKGEYNPFSMHLSFESLHIRRVGDGAIAPSSALPLGASRKIDETRLVKVEPTVSSLLFSVMAVCFSDNEDMLLDQNVAGFIYVTEVDENKKTITFLSPSPGKLPSHHFILGNIKWIEK